MNNHITSTIEVLDSGCAELDFQGHCLRYRGTAENLKFVAEDVLLALGLNKAVLNQIPEEFKDLVCTCVDRKGQLLLWKELVQTVNQDGLDYLISCTSKPTALEFQKWFYKEALPFIRKTA